ncbi:MAG: DNA translocase FtsK, partial [Solirubrobacteraceae bacterium]
MLTDHGVDLWGIALLTVGVLLALGTYGDAAGSAGHAVDAGLSYLLGWARFCLPPVAVALGVVVLSRRRRDRGGRVGIGTGVLLLVVCALADLASGTPGVAAGQPALKAAGGVVGAAVGHSLAGWIGTAGAVVVLVAIAIVAWVVASGVSVPAAGRALVRAAGALGRATDRPIELRELGATEPGPYDGDRVIGGDDGRRSEEPLLDGDLDRPGGAQQDAADVGACAEVDTGTDVDTDADSDTGTGEGLVGAAGSSDDGAARPQKSPGDHAWRLPPLRLLTRAEAKRPDARLLDSAGQSLVAALAAHGVETHLVGRTTGPTVTRYELELASGVKVARVTSLHRDIAYAMASPDVRILAPIPGRSAIGVEVPNRQRQLVALGDILASSAAREARHPLEVALGRDIAGRPVMVNLADMPHVLISGATGAGKSSCINSLITSVLMRATPDDVRLILVDPKRVELGQYNGLPHLLSPVVVDPKKAANALAWAVKEMERRYDLLAERGVRDITGYRETYERDAADVERLPFILVVVDELNDLMMVAARDVEDSVCRIAQMARAVGIHLVLATQRPSVDVITGVIKANIPSRMSFSVSSLADSRVILDQPGAERLVGKGDMLILTASSSVARRLQSPWVSEPEVRAVVGHWRRQG